MAVGTIPGSSLQIGSSSTIDAAGYFNDADGDELTYTGSSSNEGVATVSMEGSSATITAVSAGDAVITITASDGSASASQGFTVTVAAAPVNNPPVAVGTIPGSTLEIGGTATIDASGHFSDADGDELTYTGSSSNPGVATVSMEGSSATITAVSAGDAVITIMASDGEASVSQSFRVEVSSGPEEATVVISRLLDDSRNTIGDPTGIARTIHVVLDVQSNDETWTDIGLTMNGETVMPMCRGTGGSAGDAAPGPGLAAAGQAEIECLLRTDAVMGMCEGMPLDPTYPNGAYQLGAFLVTDAGERREVIAPLPIALGNSNRVDIAFVPSGNHVLDRGTPIYGGPSSEEDMSAFHACPVSFDGTAVGTISLVANSTGPEGAQPHQPGTSLSFTEPTTMPAMKFNGMAADRESTDGFTWDVNSEWNADVEDEGPGGREHWVLVEKIENAAGLDVRNDFATAPAGPYYFDFKAPEPGAIEIGGDAPMAGTHYSDKAYADKSTNTIRLSSIMDGGVGVDSATIMIGVGDCSAAANLYDAKTKMPDRTMTPFEAVKTFAGKDQGHVSMLDEEDANRAGPGKDSNGLDCYVAELTGLADKLGNAFDGGKTPAGWLQTVNFGVDKTAPSMTEERPRNGLVFNQLPALDFVFDNPDLGSGDGGTGIDWSVKMAAMPDPVDAGMVDPEADDREVVVNLDAAVVTAKEGAKSITVTASDMAMPPNTDSHTWEFSWDVSASTYSISRTQGDIGTTGASSVNVSVAGAISDMNEIESATLRLLLRANEGAECFNGTLDELEALEKIADDADNVADRDAVIPSRIGKPGHMRALENGTNSIAFDQTFVVSKPEGNVTAAEGFCFRLDVEDEARNAQARAASTGNTAKYADVGNFKVEWPRISPPVAVNEIDAVSLMVGEMETVDFEDNFSSPDGDALTYTSSSSDEDVATVTHTGTEATITAVAVGTADITITATDDEGSATQTFTVTVTRVPLPTFTFSSQGGDGSADVEAVTELDVPEGTATGATWTYWVKLPDGVDEPTAAAPVNVTITADAGLEVNPATLDFWDETLGTPAAVDSVEVQVGTAHDLDIESNEGALTHSATGFDPASLMVTSLDDDYVITADVASIEEDDAATEVTVTVTAGTAPTADTDVLVTFTGVNTENTDLESTSDATATVTIEAGELSGTATASLDAAEDVEQGADDLDESISLTGSIGGTASAQQGVYLKSASIAIVDNDPDGQLSVTIDGVATNEVNEDAGTVTLVITATMDAPVDGITTFALGNATASGNIGGTANGGSTSGDDYIEPAASSLNLTINARETTGSTTVTLQLNVTNDGAGTTSETIIFGDVNGAGGLSVKPLTITILEPSS